MAITIATMGLLIKKCDTGKSLWAQGLVAGAGAAAAEGEAAGTGVGTSSNNGLGGGELTGGIGSGMGVGVAAGAEGGTKGLGVTREPFCTFWPPSITTVSPALRPSAITQSLPVRIPGLTVRISTVLSLPTTATPRNKDQA